MRTFDEVAEANDLYLWSNSRIGTLYLPRERALSRPLFRRFGDGELEMVQPYAEIVEACRSWIEARPELSAVVAVRPVEEVGRDFIRRNFKPAYVTLRRFYQQAEPGWEDDRIEPLSPLPEALPAITEALSAEATGRGAVVEAVMRASLLRGSGKTVERQDGDGWVVVEPSIGAEDIQAWIAAAPQTPARRPAQSSTGPIYQRQGQGEYFENEIANTWGHLWWGYTGFAKQSLGVPTGPETNHLLQSESASQELRDEVADYLDASPYAVVGMQRDTDCYFCTKARFNGAAHRSDGVWLWPDDLGHCVRRHGFVVPNRMVDHIRAEVYPPQKLTMAVVESLQWPGRSHDGGSEP